MIKTLFSIFALVSGTAPALAYDNPFSKMSCSALIREYNATQRALNQIYKESDEMKQTGNKELEAHDALLTRLTFYTNRILAIREITAWQRKCGDIDHLLVPSNDPAEKRERT